MINSFIIWLAKKSSDCGNRETVYRAFKKSIHLDRFFAFFAPVVLKCMIWGWSRMSLTSTACVTLLGESQGCKWVCPGAEGKTHNMQNPCPYPKHSMYAIYAYIGVVWGVIVCIYGIHGVSGIW